MTARADNFNRTDASSLGTPSDAGSAWVTPQGDLFSISSNQAAGGGAARAINYLECSAADGTLTVTKSTHAASSYGGLIFRLVDNDNYWFFRTQPSNYGLAKIVAGAETGVGTPTGTPTSGDVLSVELSGNSITCKVNGSSIITGTDSAHNTATKHGMVAYSDTTSRFEDWSWTDAGGGGGAPVGLSTETDSALALVARQIKATGLAVETDAAIALTTTAGFDFHTAAGLIFGDLAGALTSLAREASVSMVLRVYAVASPGALVVESGTLTTDSNGRLARYTHASLVAATSYICTFIRASDGEVVSVKLTAT